MKKGVLKNILKGEIKESLKFKEALNCNIILFSLYLILSSLISKDEAISRGFEDFYRVNILIANFSCLWMITFSCIMMKINGKKNNSANYESIVKFAIYEKYGIFSMLIHQIISLSIVVFKLDITELNIFGIFMFLNLFLNILIGMKYLSADKLFTPQLDLRKK